MFFLRSSFFEIIVLLFVLFICSDVFAVQQLMALHGRATSGGVVLQTGDVQALIYDANSGGNLVYDSGTDFVSAIHSGIFDIVLGEVTLLDFNYGAYYYLDLKVNGSDLNFGGNDRKQFESSHGPIQSSAIADSSITLAKIANSAITDSKVNSSAAIAWSKISKVGAILSDLIFDSDFNSVYLNRVDGNSLYVQKSDANDIFYTQNDANNLFVKGTDANTLYAKKTGSDTILANWDLNGLFNFNGGTPHGVQIIDGNLSAYNINIFNQLTTTNVSDQNVAGDDIPSLDLTFDIGHEDMRWKNFFGGTFYGDANLTSIVLPLGAVLWSYINKAGSNLTDIVTRNHNDLQNVQGGNGTEEYHLTNSEHSNLTSISGVWSAVNTTNGTISPSTFSSPLNVIGSDDINVSASGSTIRIDFNGVISALDTNWETSWNLLDTNLKSTYYTKSQVDLNLGNYYSKSVVDTNLGFFARQADVNSWGSLRYLPIDSNLDSLADVLASAPVSGDQLMWNGTAWVSAQPTSSVGSASSFFLDITSSLADNFTLSISPSSYAETANVKATTSATSPVFF